MGLDMYLEKKKTQNSEGLELGYWRKANHIHKWFVGNVQNGIDDCGEYEVSAEKLNELLSVCRKVLETKNTDSLPTVSGFFFGTTDYSEYYFETVKETIEIIKNAIASTDFETEKLFYSSSW